MVATLWSIPDEETVALIQALFTGLAGGDPSDAALTRAQRALLRQGRGRSKAAHPVSRAAFTLTGALR